MKELWRLFLRWLMPHYTRGRVVSVEWVRAGQRLPSGEITDTDMTMIGVDGLVEPVRYGDTFTYHHAPPPLAAVLPNRSAVSGPPSQEPTP